jgi:hypothetical protein
LFCLSGCIKAQISLDIHENGTSDVGMAMGLTSQLKELMNIQGVSFDQMMNKTLSTSDYKVSTRSWTEGDYEWTEGKMSSMSFIDLNKRFTGDQELFKNFSLVKEPGLIKNRFVLDLTMQPTSNLNNLNTDSTVDTSGMVEIQFLAHMPGQVVETNGVYDSNANALKWIADNNLPVTIHAVSETWNWLNIGIFGGGVGLVLIHLLVGVIVLTRNPTKKQSVKSSIISQVPSTQVTKNPQEKPVVRTISEPIYPNESVVPATPINSPGPGLLVNLRVRNLLEQVNDHVLKNSGVIYETPNELHLAWPDPARPGSQLEIQVHAVGESSLFVNGTQCAANIKEIQAALIASLKQMKVL